MFNDVSRGSWNIIDLSDIRKISCQFYASYNIHGKRFLKHDRKSFSPQPCLFKFWKEIVMKKEIVLFKLRCFDFLMHVSFLIFSTLIVMSFAKKGIRILLNLLHTYSIRRFGCLFCKIIKCYFYSYFYKINYY